MTYSTEVLNFSNPSEYSSGWVEQADSASAFDDNTAPPIAERSVFYWPSVLLSDSVSI